MTAYEHHEPSAPISIYTIGPLRCVADCQADAVIETIRWLRDEKEIGRDEPVGIRDRDAHAWLVNPFAGGRPVRRGPVGRDDNDASALASVRLDR